MMHPKKERAIGVRELVRETKHILEATQKGASFIVRVHGKPVARLTPIDEETKRFDFTDFLKLAGTGKRGDRNLSTKIDEILYKNV